MRPGSKSIAFIWGLAEASLFFIVPDVLITILALENRRKAVQACFLAALGATIGGLGVCFAATHIPQAVQDLVLAVPGISDATFKSVQKLVTDGFLLGMLQGAFSGVPYKVFATEAGINQINPLLFAALTPIARLPRFLIAATLTGILSRLIGSRLTKRAKLGLTLGLWALFYVAYFSAVGW